MAKWTSMITEATHEIGRDSPLGKALVSLVENGSVNWEAPLLDTQVRHELQVKLEGLEGMLAMTPHTLNLSDTTREAYMLLCHEQLQACSDLAGRLEVTA
jgi:hypothetical protein